MKVAYESLSPDGKAMESRAMERQSERKSEVVASPEQLAVMVESLAAKKVAGLKSEVESLRESLAKAESTKNAVVEMASLAGYGNPLDTSGQYAMMNPNYPRDKGKKGLLREMESLSEKAPNMSRMNNRGQLIQYRETNTIDEFVAENYKPLLKEFDEALKDNGLLGGRIRYGQEAPTTRTDILPLFIDTVSSYIRKNKSSENIFWQFSKHKFDLGKMPGDTVKVYRARNLATPLKNDRGLTPGTPLSTSYQNLTVGSVNIVLDEWGLGKDASNGLISIPEFYEAHTSFSLSEIVRKVLGADFYLWEDVVLRNEFLNSTNILWGQSGNVNSAADTVNDTPMSLDILMAAANELFEAKVPTIDGKYIAILSPKAKKSFNASLSQNVIWDNVSKESMANMLSSYSGVDIGRTSGYAGTINDVAIFFSNNFGTGAAGQPGVHNQGGTTYRESLILTGNAVGYAISKPYEIRMDSTSGNMRRDMLFGWLQYSEAAALDVSSSLDAEQQDFVYKIRTKED